MEDFVNFSIAKKLKEKGFREPCLGWYYPFEVCGFDYKTSIVFNNSAYRGSNYKDMLVSHKDEKYIDAPTISQVLKWLFDEKQLFVNIDCNICDKFGLFFTIYKKGEETWEACGFDDNYYNKPEETTLASIEYILDNLI